MSVRLRDLFLAPADGAPARRVAERVVPATVGVLGPPREGAIAAASVALATMGARRARCAVICRWDGREAAPRPGLASISARRLADRLERRGVQAAARGRLVTVGLAAEPAEARAAVERLLVAVEETPLVVLVAGPRPPALDPLLATLDRLVVVTALDAPPGLGDLALDEAAALGRSVARIDLPDTPLGSLVASTGRPFSPGLRAAATAALGGDRDG
ncbi:hypothetical protein [Baekduia sp. Peel2402]|uniref:hypothetical protein n=1 Tax=Baekduia sp. Peel2402 TaxID=3458296 RepID=UPI00403ED16E